MYRLFSIIFFSFFFSLIHAQGKEIISEEDEVFLPLDSLQKDVFFSITFNEGTYGKIKMKKMVYENKLKYYDSTKFFLLEETDSTLDFFIVYPCVLIDESSFHEHKLIKEGIVISNFNISFLEKKYTLELKDFYWVNNRKVQTKIIDIYKKYNSDISIREKVKLYGVLKSAENSIAETLSNFSIVIEDIIQTKFEKSK